MKRFLVVFIALFLSGCATSEVVESGGSSGYENIELYTITDADLDVTSDNPTEISFEENQPVYMIDSEGDYIISGKHEGQIQIDVQDRIVHLILDNVQLQSKEGPVIYVKSAAKVVITIPENTHSVLKDSTNYVNWENARACIFSEDDLTINGGGTLQAYGYCNDAIRTKDVLKILDVNVDIVSRGPGLRGNDGVLIQDANLNVQCEETGIYTEKQNKKTQGFVVVSGGTAKIISGEYGINASQNVYIRECSMDIYGMVQDIICSGEQYIQEGCLE